MWNLQFSIIILWVCNILEMTTINDFVLKKFLCIFYLSWVINKVVYQNVNFDWLATLQIDQQTTSKQRIYFDAVGTLQGKVQVMFQIAPNYDLLWWRCEMTRIQRQSNIKVRRRWDVSNPRRCVVSNDT